MRNSLIAICDRIDKIDVQLQSLHSTPSIEDKIPQLDGILQDVNYDDDLDKTILRCEYCQVEFSSRDQLEAHAGQMIAACEECGLCFESEFISDVQEHDIHTEEYFQVNSLTPTRKRRAYERFQLEFRGQFI